MKAPLSRRQIGERITKLRNIKGLSQEELAKSIKMSRPSLTQIELGNRQVSFIELQKIAHALHFTLDDFVSDNFFEKLEAVDFGGVEQPETEIRVSTPELQVNKFKNVLLYILERCAGKPNVGETVLYKLLYFSDFNYYELYEEHLTGATYRRLNYGPVPQHLENALFHMTEEGQLQRVKTIYHGYSQMRYLPLVKADLSILKANEKEVIDKVIEQMSDWNATKISEYVHKDMPWLASDEGEVIDYELAFYREAPFSVRNYEE
ncbi:MAG: type II toxin-antitoxin system antitoxin SocA domain-containing protein [Anaerovoracaceae bacterium]|jgi:transcriptional regulator with XRE-family HTH domain